MTATTLPNLSTSTAKANQVDLAAIDPSKQRNECIYCDPGKVVFDPKIHEHNLVPCNVRAFEHRSFTVWRCDKCKSLNCLDVVDLNHYYSKYSIYPENLDFILRKLYSNLLKRFTHHGMKKHHSFLDYGCNRGQFCQYLTQYCGFTNVHGYDPYSPVEEYRDLEALEKRAPFDFINLQDVLEHVEAPDDLMKHLASLLKPGGFLHVGTPDAAKINLQEPTVMGSLNFLHAPYHLHIPTAKNVHDLACKHGLVRSTYYDRQFTETYFVFNEKVSAAYQEMKDGCINVIGEPVDICSAICNPKIIYYALFGYFLYPGGNMATMFCKPMSHNNNNQLEKKKNQ